jgi:hypothetical protein
VILMVVFVQVLSMFLSINKNIIPQNKSKNVVKINFLRVNNSWIDFKNAFTVNCIAVLSLLHL